MIKSNEQTKFHGFFFESGKVFFLNQVKEDSYVTKCFVLSFALATLLFVPACSLHKEWNYVERLGLTPNQKLIPMPYEPSPERPGGDQQFLLYYFTTQPFDTNKPSILFIGGGPGIVKTDDEGLVRSLTGDYNVVYFHPRGSGFSQFPESSRYDRYLRIKYAVEDIERIRKHLGLDHWDAIVSHSAGTVLAQQYVAKYGPDEKVRKLVLSAPQSRHIFALSSEELKCKHDPAICAADKLAKDIRDKHREALQQIYRHHFQEDPEQNGEPSLIEYEGAILDAVDGILHRVDQKFGNLPFVIDEYERLQNFPGLRRRDLLKEHALDFSKAFFVALRRLRFVGWIPLPAVQEDQQRIGLIIARELACKFTSFSSWTGEIKTMSVEATSAEQETKESHSYCNGIDALKKLMSVASNGGLLRTGRPDRWAKDMNETRLRVLREIYETEFKELGDYKDIILRAVENILDRVERQFGGLQFVIRNYKELSVKQKPQKVGGPFGAALQGEMNDLSKNALAYDLPFFKALQGLGYIGSSGIQDDSEVKRQQRSIAVVIVRELATTNEPLSKSTKEVLRRFVTWEPVIDGEKIAHATAIDTIDRIDINKPTHWAKEMKARQLEILTKIYKNTSLDLNGYEETILQEAKRILDLVEIRFAGCLQCIIANYDRPGLKLKSELQNLRLDFPDESIYVALKNLLDMDTSFTELSRQRYLGAIIGSEIACRIGKELEVKFRNVVPARIETTHYCDAAAGILLQPPEKQSERVYYVISAYDGLHIGFLKEWLAGGRRNVKGALTKSAGEVHFERCGKLLAWIPCLIPVNQYVEKVGIVNDLIEAWDPAKFPHKVPTLILEGGADPVTAGGQPDHIRDHALSGPRTLIRVPGVGHGMEFPSINTTDRPLGSRGPCAGSLSLASEGFLHTDVRGCLIASFIEMDFNSFQKARVLREIQTNFQSMLKESTGIQNQNHRVRVFHCLGAFRSNMVSAGSSNLPKDPGARSSFDSKRPVCEEVSVFQ